MQIGCETKKILDWYRMNDEELKEIDENVIKIKEILRPELYGIVKLINRLGNCK